MALGNVVMGVVFSLVYLRTGRLGPLILPTGRSTPCRSSAPSWCPPSWIDAINAA